MGSQAAASRKEGLARGRAAPAFTLVELLVVVVIIGVLAAFAVPQYLKAVESARMTEAMTLLSTMAAKVESLYAKDGVLPPPAAVQAPPEGDYRYGYSQTPTSVRADRAVDGRHRYSGFGLQYNRRSGGDWCWSFSGPSRARLSVDDTPIPAKRCCNPDCV